MPRNTGVGALAKCPAQTASMRPRRNAAEYKIIFNSMLYLAELQ